MTALSAIQHNYPRALDRFSKLLNSVGAAALAAMMLLTTVDVVLRYIFSTPITGSLEITEFLLLITVASGIAYTGIKKAHVTVDVAVERLAQGARSIMESTTNLLSLAIFGMLTWRVFQYAQNLRDGNFESPSLFWPVAPFAYFLAFGAMVFCLVLLLYTATDFARMIKGNRRRIALILVPLAVTALFFLLPFFGKDLGIDIGRMQVGFLSIVLLVIMLFTGMRIGLVMALVGFIGIIYINGFGPAATTLGSTPFATASNYGMSVIPLFILMGTFCFYSGLTKDLYYTVYRWIGHLPGGLAMATIGACAGFAAVSGSSVASVATLGTVALPEMKRYKYDSALATGCIAAGSSIGVLIPPSLILVIYGIITEQSIGKLFLAGFIPGILEAVFYMITIFIICKRNPAAGPSGEVTTIKEKVGSLKNTWGVLLLFVLVIGGIYTGIFTPTEAAGVGAFGAFLFALGRRKLSWKNFVDSLLETQKTTAMIFTILIGAGILGVFLAVSRLPFELADIVAVMQVNRYVILVLIILIHLFLGAIMSSIGMIVLTIPVIFPIVQALNFDPIWFGIIVVRVVEIGQITPPVGINVFVMNGIARDVPLYTIFKGIVPFLIADFAHLALLVAVPGLSLFLLDVL